jgi:hypothetical protein
MKKKPQRCRVKLDRPVDVRRELAKLYREARMGELSTAELNRFGAFLNILLGCMRDTELQAQIEALELARPNNGEPHEYSERAGPQIPH